MPTDPVEIEEHDRIVETVLSCRDLDAMVDFLRERLGCRIDTIVPADDPSEVVLSGCGARFRAVRGDDVSSHLRLVRTDRPADDPSERWVAPNGTIVDVVGGSAVVVTPSAVPEVVVVRSSDGDAFGEGRAGMGYRDLLPGRWGGRYIASHIRIDDGGDVADYVHYHRIRFQMIFVAAGWVDVVYEDQGEPFRMHAGDCVLQPPEIRHRVLRSSPGLEVIEFGSPARHDTLVEHVIELPTTTVDARRDFGGQTFVRHVATASTSSPADDLPDGFVACDVGIGAATSGLADVRVVSVVEVVGHDHGPVSVRDGFEIVTDVVLSGCARLRIVDGDAETTVDVGPRDAVSFPAGATWSWEAPSSDFEYLDITVCAADR